jgi:hypothetical protein
MEFFSEGSDLTVILKVMSNGAIFVFFVVFI